jgi:sec-independent protein translocase protein TatA
MPDIGPWEWIFVVVIVLILFGPGRIAAVAGELGKSIRSFREGLKDGREEGPKETNGSLGPH